MKDCLLKVLNCKCPFTSLKLMTNTQVPKDFSSHLILIRTLSMVRNGSCKILLYKRLTTFFAETTKPHKMHSHNLMITQNACTMSQFLSTLTKSKFYRSEE